MRGYRWVYFLAIVLSIPILYMLLLSYGV